MKKISRAPKKSNTRVVFVDLLKQQMTDLKALRKKVAAAERLAVPQTHRPANFQLMH